MKNESGQIVIILLLVILVSLTVGLSILQNSLTDISTSTKTEQASRAFSAAESALERALDEGSTITKYVLDNSADAKATVITNLPGSSGQALEYSSVTKADFAHFWFANPATPTLELVYNQSSFEVYFGNCTQPTCESVADPPAIEVNLITQEIGSGIFKIKKYLYDAKADSGANTFRDNNGFWKIMPSNSNYGQCLPLGLPTVTIQNNVSSKYYCKAVVPPAICTGGCIPYDILLEKLILARVRVLYVPNSKIALKPLGPAGTSLPPQADIFSATGTSGDTQRKLEILRVPRVVPYFFDFSVFSTGEIEKDL